MPKNTAKKVAIGAAVAGVVGYVAGILTAPKSGKETREEVKDAAIKAKTATEKQLKKLHNELGVLISKAQASTSKFKNFASQDFEKALQGATKAKEKARRVLSAVHEGEADDKDLQQSIDDAVKALDHLKKFVTK